MSERKKEVTVEIDTSLYSAIEEYSASAGVSERNVLNYLVSNSLDEFSSNYYHLKKGYIEMGKINLEISNAFTASENEALIYIQEE
ncbi:CopG family transcriptional regulator / antitoxin EndoAI [Atopostipes suicloacalis DSM 15692]|uniref:CopG family transcriptional regulator / antitoxin EndoAI n=1 Tax=Atopostipes suicloacalis DSM 15692 TaxID=1121025 RepID=A0A1M4YH89_9LACT|nr:hypothetical protein [Atopostipes suicloacalis]SHF04806.1 CopG family transcriptional regulator / antitoxin EndoAI [Atopostipes suicloacalis DSM 15692]